ncbi:hypothetical protein BDV98DRAFT_600637 [Pterulicium gracile]|uniref:DUF3533 domain-containing protein n=1 Tax=Pterulicium gracile TaxID=1884261 RepID=A0A5C3R1D0_9AGAR|nr:hypothetical protein BDV98DRAFT_600637 [Pterula gracilis]
MQDSASARPFDTPPDSPQARHQPLPENNRTLTILGSTPEDKLARSTYFKTIFGGSLLIVLAIYLVFSIYWGSLWDTPAHIHKIHGWVVDFDGGEIGQAVVSALQQAQSQNQITWVVKDQAQFPDGPSGLAYAVHDQKCWAAIAINPGASGNLSAALAAVNASYNGSLAITAYGNEGRNENSFRSIIRPQIEGILRGVSSNLARQVSQDLASSNLLPEILASSPQTLLQPVSFIFDNIHPFDVPVAMASTFVGLIYLVILSFMCTMISFGARMGSGYEFKLSISSLVRLRVATPFFMYFFISLFYSLLNLAFQVPFNRAFGASGFVIYWMLQWCGMLALGLALEAMLTLLTERFTPFFMVLWIIANVSVAALPVELLPGVFKYAYATPFFNLNEGSRAIIFGTKNELGLNFGVLIAWIVLSLLTMPLFIWIKRRKLGKKNIEDAPRHVPVDEHEKLAA